MLVFNYTKSGWRVAYTQDAAGNYNPTVKVGETFKLLDKEEACALAILMNPNGTERELLMEAFPVILTEKPSINNVSTPRLTMGDVDDCVSLVLSSSAAFPVQFAVGYEGKIILDDESVGVDKAYEWAKGREFGFLEMRALNAFIPYSCTLNPVTGKWCFMEWEKR